MRIVMLYLKPSIEGLVQEVLAWEGYSMLATPEVEVAL